MNNLGARKLWGIGQQLRSFEGKPIVFGNGDEINFNSWFDLTSEDAWIDWVKRKEITNDQIEIIKQGYYGKLLQNPESSKAEDKGSFLFPFGVHKGKSIEKVPRPYLLFIRTQDWIGKWPTVNDWLNRNKEALDQYEIDTNKEMDSISELRKNLEQYGQH